MSASSPWPITLYLSSWLRFCSWSYREDEKEEGRWRDHRRSCLSRTPYHPKLQSNMHIAKWHKEMLNIEIWRWWCTLQIIKKSVPQVFMLLLNVNMWSFSILVIYNHMQPILPCKHLNHPLDTLVCWNIAFTRIHNASILCLQRHSIMICHLILN